MYVHNLQTEPQHISYALNESNWKRLACGCYSTPEEVLLLTLVGSVVVKDGHGLVIEVYSRPLMSCPTPMVLASSSLEK